MSEPRPEQPPYGPVPSEDPDGTPTSAVAVIDGHSGRTLANALTLTFVENGTQLAVVKQGGGAGKKLGILLGFKNYEPMTTTLEIAGLPTLVIPTRDSVPTPLAHEDGTPVATLKRGASSAAFLPDGTLLLRFLPDPVAHETPERYRLQVVGPAEEPVARLDVVLSSRGWDPDTLTEALSDIAEWAGGGGGGNSLPMYYLGTRLVLLREPSPVEREVLLAACVEIAVGGRPYTKDMGSRDPAPA